MYLTKVYNIWQENARVYKKFLQQFICKKITTSDKKKAPESGKQNDIWNLLKFRKCSGTLIKNDLDDLNRVKRTPKNFFCKNVLE